MEFYLPIAKSNVANEAEDIGPLEAQVTHVVLRFRMTTAPGSASTDDFLNKVAHVGVYGNFTRFAELQLVVVEAPQRIWDTHSRQFRPLFQHTRVVHTTFAERRATAEAFRLGRCINEDLPLSPFWFSTTYDQERLEWDDSADTPSSAANSD